MSKSPALNELLMRPSKRRLLMEPNKHIPAWLPWGREKEIARLPPCTRTDVMLRSASASDVTCVPASVHVDLSPEQGPANPFDTSTQNSGNGHDRDYMPFFSISAPGS